jgi:hypothetical protein
MMKVKNVHTAEVNSMVANALIFVTQSAMNDRNGTDFPWRPATDWGGMAGNLLE